MWYINGRVVMLVWVKTLWTTVGGKNFPPFLYMGVKLKELSIFIDESGDFGEIGERPAYYLVTMLYHEQSQDITENVHRLEESVRTSGFDIEYIHTAPIIRREGIFAGYSIDERRKLIYKMLNFLNRCKISHNTVVVDRREALNKVLLSGKLAKAIAKIIEERSSFFNQYEKIIVYYDNGQNELSSILNAVFSLQFENVEFRKAEPQKYRLLQLADFVCTFELLNIKRTEKRLSKSEEKFFYKPNELKKTFLKSVIKKRQE